MGLTAVLRFVPYVGTLLAALLPACLAFAIFPGWVETLQTLAMFLVLDMVTGYFIEPVLFGQRTGVSSFALLVSALFWIWVWGPIGLLLSTPLTVCIAVLGRHVRSLRFLAIIFSDEPALVPHVRYYQRLLARDEDEANVLASRKAAELGVVGVMDGLLIPALTLAGQHRSQDEITAEDFDFILDSTAEIVGQIRTRQKAPPESGFRVLVLGVPAPADRLVLDMLCTAVAAAGHSIDVVTDDPSIEATLGPVISASADLMCIVAVSQARGAEARNYCRRIRAARPDAKLLVLRPLPDTGDMARSVARMQEAGADCVATSVHQALQQIRQLLTAKTEKPDSLAICAEPVEA